MTQSYPSAATVAAKIRSLAIEKGRHSIAGRLRLESLDAVAQRLAPNFSRALTDDDLVAALQRFSERHPGHFLTSREVSEAQRMEYFQKNNRKATDTTREALSSLSPEERLHFANSGELPKSFLGKDDTND
jgi:hypothetical protein